MNKNPSNIWIVNHPYHLNDINNYNQKYPGNNRYIYIPHRKIEFKAKEDIIVIERFKDVISLYKLHNLIKESLKNFDIKDYDRIFVFNGQELMNNIVLSYIARKFCKNIMVIDDGTSGYQFYIEKPQKSDRWLDKLKVLIFKAFFRIKLIITKIGDLYYYTLHPDFVSHIIFPYKIKHNNALEVECILPPKIQTSFDEKSIVFLSQPFYLPDPGYLTYDEYVTLLDNILIKLADKYSIIYFKPHPNDSIDLVNRLQRNQSVNFITTEKTFEEFIKENHSEYIYSFNSNALLFSHRYSRKTVWLYKLVSENCAKDFEYLDNIIPVNDGSIVNNFAEL